MEARSAGWIALLSLAMCIAAPARAQDDVPVAPAVAAPSTDPPERIEARQRYQQGVVFFRSERYREAIAEFTAAYAAWDNPLILYSLGQSYEHLLEVPHAIDAYTRFLADVPDDDPRRAEVTAKLDTLRLLLATLRVESNVPASVWIEDEQVGTAPGDVALSVGRWEIEVRAEGYETHREAVSLAARATETLSVTLAPRVHTRVIERGGRVPVEVFAAFTTAAIVATVTAVVLGAYTLVLADRYQHEPVPLAAHQADGRSWSTATDVAGVTAGALGITAFVLAFLTDFGDAPEPPVTTSLVVTPNGAMMSLGAVF